MNSLLEKIYETGQVEDAQGQVINPFPTTTPKEIGRLLNDLIQTHNLQKTLEIGMAYGLSTLSICQAHHNKGSGSHTAIDPYQSKDWKSIGLLNIERAGLQDKLRFFEASADEVLPQLVTQQEKFDFAFIDGLHLFDYTVVEFFYIDKLLSVGGYIAFDDVWMPSVRKVISFVLKNRAYKLIAIDTKPSFTKRIARISSRFLQNPLELSDARLKLIPENVLLLQKTGEDDRAWDFHRHF